MNKIIKQELEKVKATKLEFDDNTLKLTIPKTTEIAIETLAEGNVYMIELSDAILNPQANSVLAANWNAGKSPTHKVYKAEVLQLMANMVKVNAIPVENNQDIFSENFFGWLPTNSITIISKL